MPPPSTSSLKQSDRPGAGRLVALDAARGLAVAGMVVVNVGPRGGDSLAEMLYRLPYGRASLLFMLLGGIGFSLLSRRARSRETSIPAGSILWRALVLFVGGLLLQALDHGVSVILVIYAVLFIVALPLTRAAGGVLLVLAGFSASLGPILWLAVQEQTDKRFDREPLAATDSPWDLLTGTLIIGPYPVAVWVAPFLLGMWLGRRDLTSQLLSTRLIMWGAVSALGARATSFALITYMGEPTSHQVWQRLISSVAHSQMPLWLVESTGVAIFVLGLCLKIADRGTQSWLQPLVKLGQLAFTGYVGHLLILALAVRPGPANVPEGLVISALILAVLTAFSLIWRRLANRGPLEMLLRPPRVRPSGE
ncbi:hypothetical protein GCM10023354_03120 [Garicola koreensis]